ADIDDPQERIAWRLYPEDFRVARTGGTQSFGVGLVDELDPEVLLARQSAEKPIGTAIAVVRRDHQVFRLQQMTCRRNRTHARAGDDRARPALQGSQGIAQGVACRIARARVVVGSFFAEVPE